MIASLPHTVLRKNRAALINLIMPRISGLSLTPYFLYFRNNKIPVTNITKSTAITATTFK